jgi:hypothetical protein
MSQATEMAIKDALEKFLEKHPVREPIYIAIVDGVVTVGTSVQELKQSY